MTAFLDFGPGTRREEKDAAREKCGHALPVNDPATSPPEPGLEVRSYFVRGRNALLTRADFGELYVDYYLHQGQLGAQHAPGDDELLKQALAAVTLHSASRPWSESVAWTIHLGETGRVDAPGERLAGDADRQCRGAEPLWGAHGQFACNDQPVDLVKGQPRSHSASSLLHSPAIRGRNLGHHPGWLP